MQRHKQKGRVPFHVCCGCEMGWWASAGVTRTPVRSSSSSDAPRGFDPSALSTQTHGQDFDLTILTH